MPPLLFLNVQLSPLRKLTVRVSEGVPLTNGRKSNFSLIIFRVINGTFFE